MNLIDNINVLFNKYKFLSVFIILCTIFLFLNILYQHFSRLTKSAFINKVKQLKLFTFSNDEDLYKQSLVMVNTIKNDLDNKYKEYYNEAKLKNNCTDVCNYVYATTRGYRKQKQKYNACCNTHFKKIANQKLQEYKKIYSNAELELIQLHNRHMRKINWGVNLGLYFLVILGVPFLAYITLDELNHTRNKYKTK